MSDEEDLYGDLGDAKIAAPKKPPPYIDTTKLEELQGEVDKLRQENETLKRNIGTLFRTARAEIKRKNAKIEALEDELNRKNGGG